jgi:hypothetical protein
VTGHWKRLRIALAALVAFGCATPRSQPSIAPTLVSADGDALAVRDALEALIDEGRDTPSDREFAYASVLRSRDDGGPGAPYARASVTGRLIQQKGLRAAALVSDVERSALESRGRDPEFRNGASTRLLGTLYVMAPGNLLSHGNSELGIELLEGLAKEYPGDLENHLRLAEAYLALGDTNQALPHLCLCFAEKLELRRSDQLLLDQLVGGDGVPACVEVAPGPR